MKHVYWCTHEQSRGWHSFYSIMFRLFGEKFVESLDHISPRDALRAFMLKGKDDQ